MSGFSGHADASAHRGEVVWLTGASSGIGRALAIRLAAGGARVFATARNAAALAELQREHGIEPVPADITKRAEVLAAAGRIRTAAGRIDLLIANAGTCEYLDVRAFDSALVERVFAVNFFGFVYTVEAALPLLRAGRVRYIVGIGSTAAWTGLPRAEAYGASKAAMHHFLESLRVDLTPEDFSVSVVAPGFVDTPLSARNDFPMPMMVSAEQAVDGILAGMRARRHEIHFPAAFSLSLKMLRLLPSRWRNRLYQRLLREELP